jgi:hypothetical protein
MNQAFRIVTDPVYSALHIKGKAAAVRRVLHSIGTKTQPISFNCIRPMPACLDTNDNPHQLRLAHAAVYGDWERAWCLSDLPPSKMAKTRAEMIAAAQTRHPSLYTLAERAKANLEATGATDWYSWQLENWGVRLDAMEVEVERHTAGHVEIRFETDMTAPVAIFEALHAAYPDVEISGGFSSDGLIGDFDGGKISYRKPKYDRAGNLTGTVACAAP